MKVVISGGFILAFGLLYRSRVPIMERMEGHGSSHRAFSHGALDAALNRLMMQPEHPADRKERRIFPIGQQYPRALDPARRLRSRLRYRSQLRRIRISERQFNRSPPRRHDLPSAPLWAHATYIGVRKPR